MFKADECGKALVKVFRNRIVEFAIYSVVVLVPCVVIFFVAVFPFVCLFRYFVANDILIVRLFVYSACEKRTV